jgi:hypothetical protein
MEQILPAFALAATWGKHAGLSRCDRVHVFNAEPAKPAERGLAKKQAKIAKYWKTTCRGPLAGLSPVASACFAGSAFNVVFFREFSCALSFRAFRGVFFVPSRFRG